MKIAVIGADGQLGTDLIKLDKTLIPLTISDLDITDLKMTQEVLEKYSPDAVINTAAYNRVDDAEDNPEVALRINTIGARNLAYCCLKANTSLVHISTDYVFSGEKNSPYFEEDDPNPKSVYGISKLAGEQMVEYLVPNHFTIRTAGLYGTAGCLGKGGSNFVENMIKFSKEKDQLNVVDDEIVSTTNSRDLSKKILELIPLKAYGLYHITNSGQCSWFEFANKIFEYLSINVNIKPIKTEELKSKAHRPKYSVLGHGHLKKLGIDDLQTWEKALKAYLIEKGHIKQ